MRIWDVSPGYLNRGSLLGEHRELHGLLSILLNGKKGYSSHPETLRWVGAENGLVVRHNQLGAEMRLRGYVDRTPLAHTGDGAWPAGFVTEPHDQFRLLGEKYQGRDQGRIPLPADAQQLWAQHKYSVLARSPETARRIGRDLAEHGAGASMEDLARDLVLLLRRPPEPGRLANAVEHMWGHVRRHVSAEEVAQSGLGPQRMFELVQRLALEGGEEYLLHSTALGELAIFMPELSPA